MQMVAWGHACSFDTKGTQAALVACEHVRLMERGQHKCRAGSTDGTQSLLHAGRQPRRGSWQAGTWLVVHAEDLASKDGAQVCAGHDWQSR